MCLRCHALGFFTPKMDRILSNIGDLISGQNEHSAHYAPDEPQSTTSPSLSEAVVYRYRKQYGINLGSWFTLERWISEAPFKEVDGQCDLALAHGPHAKQHLEAHWDSWLKDEDWDWIRDHGYNTVRIPIGYYHICGLEPSVIHGTDFEPYRDVYEGAWKRISRAISTAASYGIGVLVDLHAAPGAQNKDPHAGTGTGQVHFWEPHNQSATVRALRVLAAALSPIPNVVGLELLNEPANNDSLQGWYEDTIRAIRSALPPRHADEFPIYVGDAWDPNWYASWTGQRHDFVVLDHHVYRCFTPEDLKLTGDQHAHNIQTDTRGWFTSLSSKAKGNFVIGEWSGALGPSSVGLPGADAGEQDRQRRVFVRAQSEVFDATSAGSFFWTYKKGQGWDAGWSARDSRLADILPHWRGGVKRGIGRGKITDNEKQEALRKAYDSHVAYWEAHGHGSKEPWRFQDGFSKGWDDAKHFSQNIPASNSSPTIGFLGRWTSRRVADHVQEKGTSPQLWEFEHGFEQGANAAVAALAD
ncbi:putative cytoplasm protein [Cantharellus anzutake]|uniref:putative cytoplasm protein n=1 Tax=Cantharellus anzutake TaxID=1750568 RepID=UPI001904B18C|nr:putative cytoplasm protein [Cantharellus anzutake]KAF8342202.1 putative cytoplasm protein [Cantharellus anzutake]